MFLPTLFGVDIKTGDADVGHFGGALIVAVSVVCMGKVLRFGRYLNVPLTLLVGRLPWILAGGSVGDAIT